MMRKALLIVIGGITLASMSTTVEAKRHCNRPEKTCAPKCEPKLCCTPAEEIRGVLCRVECDERIVQLADECCEETVPCVGTRKMKLPNTVKYRVVEECVEGEEIDVPCIENSCCKKTKPCYTTVKCIKYTPIDINVQNPCEEPASSCNRSNDMDMDK